MSLKIDVRKFPVFCCLKIYERLPLCKKYARIIKPVTYLTV